MLSADEIAGRLLIGWRAMGTRLKVYLRLPELQLEGDPEGTVSDFVAGDKLVLELDGSRVEIPLEGLALSPNVPLRQTPELAKIPEWVGSSVAIMRGSHLACFLVEIPKPEGE